MTFDKSLQNKNDRHIDLSLERDMAIFLLIFAISITITMNIFAMDITIISIFCFLIILKILLNQLLLNFI
uniref:Uncharacterized protein n=1 Tax=viral metagenome TaxID=1070528 RepID=A0A6C0LR86_9ZZZZ